jgi:hypothetical protein
MKVVAEQFVFSAGFYALDACNHASAREHLEQLAKVNNHFPTQSHALVEGVVQSERESMPCDV